MLGLGRLWHTRINCIDTNSIWQVQAWLWKLLINRTPRQSSPVPAPYYINKHVSWFFAKMILAKIAESLVWCRGTAIRRQLNVTGRNRHCNPRPEVRVTDRVKNDLHKNQNPTRKRTRPLTPKRADPSLVLHQMSDHRLIDTLFDCCIRFISSSLWCDVTKSYIGASWTEGNWPWPRCCQSKLSPYREDGSCHSPWHFSGQIFQRLNYSFTLDFTVFYC